MEYINFVEVLLFPKLCPIDLRQKELIKWLTTTAQSIIEKQLDRNRKLSLRIFDDAPGICMS
jgi:hypothetical protein